METMITAGVGITLLVIAGLVLFFGTLFTVKQQTVAVIERFGRYVRTAKPGLCMKVPVIEDVAKRVSMKVQQLIVKVETKTQDNVFVTIPIAVQYQVMEGHEADSYYKLNDHERQIESFVLDVVRAQVPTMPLDQVFEKKDDIGNAVKKHLDDAMRLYGFTILNALVRDVDPAKSVKDAMNEIQTQTRLQVAAAAKGEANKIIAVKNAEAERETKRLQGEGVAAEREAIASGIRKSVEMLKEAGGENFDPSEAMRTLLMTQYFDTLARIGTQSHATTIFVPHSPGGMADIGRQIADGVMVGNQAPKAPPAPAREVAHTPV